MHYLDPTNKLLIFIGWWASYPPFFKGNLEKTFLFSIDFLLHITFAIQNLKDERNIKCNMIYLIY